MNYQWAHVDQSGARWHVVTVGPSLAGGGTVTRRACDQKQMYSYFPLTRFEGKRPNEIEHLMCKRCLRLIDRGAV